MDELNDILKFVSLKLAHSLSYSPAGVRLGEGIIAFDRTLALSIVVWSALLRSDYMGIKL